MTGLNQHKKAPLLSRIWAWRFKSVILLLEIPAFLLRLFRLPGQSVLNELLALLKFCLYPLERPTFYVTRYVEIPLALSALACNVRERILDLGSGLSPLPLYMRFRDRQVISLDYSLGELKGLKKLSQYETDDPKPLTLVSGDLRKLPFRSDSFDKVFCISTLEHIPGEGDSESMREIWRILKPGGRLFLSTEFGQNETESWTEHEESGGAEYVREYSGTKKEEQKHLLFCRRYSRIGFERRILRSAPWKPGDSGIFTKPLSLRRFYDIDQKSGLKNILDFLAPLAGLFFMLFKKPLSTKKIPKDSFGFALLEKRGT